MMLYNSFATSYHKEWRFRDGAQVPTAFHVVKVEANGNTAIVRTPRGKQPRVYRAEYLEQLDSARAQTREANLESNADVRKLAEVCDTLTGKWHAIAQDMIEKQARYGELSDKQLGLVRKMIGWATESQADRNERMKARAEQLDGNLKPLVAMMVLARTNLKNPRIRIRSAIGDLAVTMAKDNSKNAGWLYLKAGSRYLGKIEPKQGLWMPVRGVEQEVTDALNEFSKDPVQAAKAYGQETNNCCFCGKLLTDDREGRSVEVGYGPICASHFGLPWGDE